MKISSTILADIAAVCFVLSAGVSAAPVENAAAAVENSGSQDLSPPHWKMPIPTWAHRATRTIDARTPQVAGPTVTAGPPVPDFPADDQLSYPSGWTLSILTTTQTWYGRNHLKLTAQPLPTILACDGLHPETYSYEKCISEVKKLRADEKKKTWEDQIMNDAKKASELAKQRAKLEADENAKQEALEKQQMDAKKKQWEKEMKKTEERKKKEEAEREKKEEKARKKEEKKKAKAKAMEMKKIAKAEAEKAKAQKKLEKEKAKAEAEAIKKGKNGGGH